MYNICHVVVTIGELYINVFKPRLDINLIKGSVWVLTGLIGSLTSDKLNKCYNNIQQNTIMI